MPKSEMIRIVRDPQGEVSLDFTGKKNGRGAYVCKDRACLQKCIKAKIPDRIFSCKIEDDVYQRLLNEYDSAD